MAKSHGLAIAELNLTIAELALNGTAWLLSQYGCWADEAKPKPHHATPWQHYTTATMSYTWRHARLFRIYLIPMGLLYPSVSTKSCFASWTQWRIFTQEFSWYLSCMSASFRVLFFFLMGFTKKWMIMLLPPLTTAATFFTAKPRSLPKSISWVNSRASLCQFSHASQPAYILTRCLTALLAQACCWNFHHFMVDTIITSSYGHHFTLGKWAKEPLTDTLSDFPKHCIAVGNPVSLSYILTDISALTSQMSLEFSHCWCKTLWLRQGM